MRLVVILGNQLFSPDILLKNLGSADDVKVFMREDFELCTHFKYHKHKIAFFLAAMRAHAQELRDAGFDIHYEELPKAAKKLEKKPEKKYDAHLAAFIAKVKPTQIIWYEIEDKFFEKRLVKVAGKIPLEVLPSPMFLTSRKQFREYLGKTKRPFMRTFYEAQRKRLKILVDEKLEPVGGHWSFDEENRKSLPKDYEFSELAAAPPCDESVSKLVVTHFEDHPGDMKDFWLPVDRAGAEARLEEFLKVRFAEFGDYEDALTNKSDFVNHSVLTPFLNVGLLTPAHVIRRTLAVAKSKKIPLNSVEGFVRQIIGWREFIRGIYQNYSEAQDKANYWQHERKLNAHWYDGTTGIEPLDDVIKKASRLGYAHHIERLMVVGSLMLLLEVHPHEAHRWFMEMFVDSSDWVMGPNVYGMAIFSDGGVFATKPYICGSNYYRKMGPYKKGGDWQEGVDGLYWSFIDKHRAYFLTNPRSTMMVRLLDKMPDAKKQILFKAGRELKKRVTVG